MLLVALALIVGHGSGISGTVTAVLLGLVVAVVLAVAVTAAVILRRLLPAQAPPGPRTVIRAVPEPGVLTGQQAALEQPAVRLHPDQLAELAEILRRSQRPAVEEGTSDGYLQDLAHLGLRRLPRPEFRQQRALPKWMRRRKLA